MGNAQRTAGEASAAILSYRRALELEPGYADALYNLGMTLHESGGYQEAEACFRRLLALEPADADALLHLGALLVRRQRLDEGALVYRKALALRPEDAHLWNRLGEVEAARFTDASLREAEACFRKAISLQPGEAHGHYALGHVLALQGRRAEAVESLRAACRVEPSKAAFQADLLHAKQQVCDWRGLPELSALVCRAALERTADPFHPFYLVSIPSTAEQQLSGARNYARSIAEPLAADARRLAFRFQRRAGGRRRIGYLSAEFHAHATAWLAAELFELHDRKRFEVIAYSYGPDDGSPMRLRLEGAFDRFRDLQAVSDAEAAAAIHADEVDILVDLKGYTFRARTGIMALRPAPIQVSFLGYPGTMGAPFIDYLVGDRIVTPAASAGDYAEKLVLMPGSYQVNDRKRAATATPPRPELGIPSGSFVFCSFNQAYKILPEVFAAWMRLLKAVPESILWLLDSAAAANLRREAQASGVEPARLVFAPPLPLERHLGRLAAADLFLDTFPCNAHTSASDALWMGVPVATRMGETFASRVAASLLEAVGLPELVTRSLADYESLAVRLARSPGELSALRERLGRARSSATLFDTPRYARSLEAAYEKMWEAYSSGAAPRLIEL
ncbi:MAG TPA: tetratricopeptide repeat protein [Burkholderiales bacterium]|nr:tetratricopeptide repeat protein [Burkholderiales bacterium]